MSAHTLVAISKSPAAVITSRIGPMSKSSAGIFPEITGRIGPSSRVALSVPVSSIWEWRIPQGGNKTTVEDGE